jgi:hypothetical protein
MVDWIIGWLADWWAISQLADCLIGLSIHLHTYVLTNSLVDCLSFFFLIRIVGWWIPNWIHSARRPLLVYCTCPGWLWGWRIWWNEERQGKPKYSEKTNPSAILFTANPTLPDPGANSGHRGGKPATNRLSYGDGLNSLYYKLIISGFF